MAEPSELAKMAVACLELRMQIPRRLWPDFALIEEAALRGAMAKELLRERPAPAPVPLRRVK